MDTKLQNRLKRNIALDYIGSFIANLNMQSAIWVLYLAYCGMSLAQIGVLEGMYHATSILCEIPSGAAADLLGRKRSMLLSRLCIAVSCIIMLFFRSFGFFAASFIMQAVGNNFNSGSEEALVYDSMKCLGQEEQYMRVYGRLNVVIEVSQSIATVAGGILAEYSYFWCYGACLAIALLAVVPVLLMKEAPYMQPRQERITVWETVMRHFQTSFAILRSDRRILRIIVWYSVVFAAETLLFFYSQQYYFQMGYNKIQISLILLLVSVASCLGAVASGKIFGRLKGKTMPIAAFVIAAALVCCAFEHMGISVVLFALAGFFNSALYPIQSGQLNGLIPSGQRATLISVSSMFFSVAMIIMFPTVGFLADCLGLTPALAGTGISVMLFVAAERRPPASDFFI